MFRLSIFIAIVVSVLWALNFIVTTLALHHFPPLLYACLRFTSILPFLLFVPKPKPLLWRSIISLGLLWGVLQFSLLNFAIRIGLSAGIAAVIMQCSIFFVMGFAFLFFREKPSNHQLIASLLGITGLAVIVSGPQENLTLSSFFMCLASSFCWGLGNIIIKFSDSRTNPALIIWSSAIAVLPLLALSWLVEGDTIVVSLQSMNLEGIACVLYSGWIALILGGMLWSYLLKMHQAHEIIPFNLLIPFFSNFLGYAFLDEALSYQQLAGGMIIIFAFGLYYNGNELIQKAYRTLTRWLKSHFVLPFSQ